MLFRAALKTKDEGEFEERATTRSFDSFQSLITLLKKCRNKRKKGFSICNQLQTLPNPLLHTHKLLHKYPYIRQKSLSPSVY